MSKKIMVSVENSLKVDSLETFIGDIETEKKIDSIRLSSILLKTRINI
ncbi:hypothetical protein NE452_17325 [Paeniclostridium sordellii]|nr:hypothetical protein [Paeniclostridium sordellii]MCQ4699207.1 hypothetical protein [Paeniclostridium sordellii]